jgi:DNA-binding SARP family transcriptional activator
MTDMSPFDHWVQVLEGLMEKYPHFTSSEIEGQVVAGMLLALEHRRMDYPQIESWVDRALGLLAAPLESNTKVSIVNVITHYFLLRGNYGKAAQVMELLQPSSSEARMNSKDTVAVVAHSTISSFFYCYVGMHSECIRFVNKGLDIARKTGFIILNNILIGHGIWSALINGDQSTSRELFKKNADSIARAKLLDMGLIEFVRSLESLEDGKLTQAALHGESALKASFDVGSQFSNIFCHLLNARVRFELGEHRVAKEHLDRACHLSRLTRTKHLMFHALMQKARFALDQDQMDEGLEALRSSLSLGKEIDLYHNMIESRSTVARLMQVALEHDIEPKYVSAYIRKRGLTPDPPPIAVENWPWPLKVFTLGRFSIVRDDEPIKFPTKAQKKPLELIKMLVALGGRNVDKTYISDALWPDVDGDKADQAFTTTLHRLRLLLGHKQALQIQSGKLELNPSCCWVDCWAFARLLSMAEDAHKMHDFGRSMHLAEKALAMYKGDFLSGDMLEPWTVSQRERLRSKFLQAANLIGTSLSQNGEWKKAADYYRRSVDIDDLSEETYQRLMHCLKQLGHKSEALAVYERCRKNLKAAFGLEPSPATREIIQTLMDGC